MTKKVLITQSNYIPWKGYFDAIQLVDEVILFDDVQYTKRDWRNRNQIKTQDGLKWLTIPVMVKGKYFQAIKDTKIDDKNWALKHLGMINCSYKTAKSFAAEKDFMESVYLNCHSIFLSEINYFLICEICKHVGIKTNIRFSMDFELIEGKTERLVNICKQTNATDYYTGPAAKNYLNDEVFKKEKINIHYLDYSNYLNYDQLYGDFVHNVSIIDLILNEGINATNFLKWTKK